MRRLTLLVLLGSLAGAGPAHAQAGATGPTGPPPPANDARANAGAISSLPAKLSGTTVGATRERSDPSAECGCDDTTVWYRYIAATDGRLIATLAADGDLDAVVDAYRQERSSAIPVAEDTTDKQGMAALRFPVKAGQSYLLRVAKRINSVDGTFSLGVTAAAPEVTPPGTPLGVRGVTETLDRVLKPQAAYSYTMREGVTYRINMVPIAPPEAAVDPNADDDDGECEARLAVFGPGTTDFDDDDPVFVAGCDSYRLFTPARGEGGKYVLQTSVPGGARGGQRYHLEIAPATDTDTAPGVALPNHVRLSGRLQASRANRVDLYRFSVTRRSRLTLRLSGRIADDLELRLRDDRGHLIDEGADVDRELRAGRFFVSVTAPAGTNGRYTLSRSSRTITKTQTTIAGSASASVPFGRTVTVGVHVAPGVSGPARVTLERFDPEAGWQYLRTVNVNVSGGRAGFGFATPSVGRFRARTEYLGTRDSAPSDSRYASVLVTSTG